MFIIQPSDTAVMDLYPTPTLSDSPPEGEQKRSRFARLVDSAVKARAHRVILLVCAIWLLNGFDLALTVIANNQGLLQEGNPVARYMLRLGTPSIVLFKIGLVLIGSYPLLRYRRARITEIGTFIILIAYALLAVHWSECYEIYTVVACDGVYMTELSNRMPG